ncbi:MAG: PHP domain-containing protein [Candidatus Omnitrophica bacterium]|nr:PHP domain-containing protein [Candidatus Omnitrophota bacterium]
MPLTFESPYDHTDGKWFRGNLHGHTTNTDGELPPSGYVKKYADLGYDWIVISDHDYLTPKPENCPKDLVFIQGNEVTARGPHLLHIGCRDIVDPNPDRARVVEEVMARDGLCIINHPNWQEDFSHWPHALIESLPPFHGIEIYNAIVRDQEGTSLATDRFDRLLSKGRRVWGYANDDTHWVESYGRAWNWVWAEECTPEAIVESLKNGRCYGSTGVELTTLRTDGRKIRIESTTGSLCIASLDWGLEIGRYRGKAWEFDLEELYYQGRRTPSYIRFEVHGEGDQVAWTQPIHILGQT